MQRWMAPGNIPLILQSACGWLNRNHLYAAIWAAWAPRFAFQTVPHSENLCIATRPFWPGKVSDAQS